MIAAQRHQSWDMFRMSSKYCLTITALEVSSILQPHSMLATHNVEIYLVVFLEGARESTKQKTKCIKGSMNPVWNKMMPFYGLKFSSESMVFELKARKAFGENPILGKFEIPVSQLMLRASGRETRELCYEFESEYTRNVLSLRLELSPTLPSKLDDEFIFNKTIGAKTQSSAMFAPSDSSMTETTLVDDNDSRDLSYLTVNENYSCLMFDCGLEKPRRPSEKKRTSTSATAFFGGLEEGGDVGGSEGTAIKL